MKYAQIAVNSPGGHGFAYSYTVPESLAVIPGMAVMVPFGHTSVQGVVMEVVSTPSIPDTKEISDALCSTPLLFPHQLELAKWISSYYVCPLFDAVSLMLPPGFERKILSKFKLSEPKPDDYGLTIKQARVLELLRSEDRVAMQRLEQEFGHRQSTELTAQLLRRGLVLKTYELEPPRIRPKFVTFLRLEIDKRDAEAESERLYPRAPSQARILAYLSAQMGPVPKSSIKSVVDSPSPAIKHLVDKGLIKLEQVRVLRDPLAGQSHGEIPKPVLTPGQQLAIDAISNPYINGKMEHPVFLLHGVTGSGKTEVYLRLLEKTIINGKRGICLVPEIALTTQTIERFYSRFPGRVAVMHSGLSLGEQYDEWHEIRAGKFDVVIGPRGAIFSPQPDLGLIIIDEEHEWTYKQTDRAPRYHARDTAIKLASFTGSTVVLGSATPDIGTYFQVESKRFHLAQLPERITPYGSTSLPEVTIVDMRQEVSSGNPSIISRELEISLRQTLEANQQAILFLNRRGTSTLVRCRKCGYTARCPRCSITLTYHKLLAKVVCHRCGFSKASPLTCPQCLQQKIGYFGYGTQAIEDEIRHLFPNARPARWDLDTASSQSKHKSILAGFLSGKSNVLIGTQMIAKGLDLPGITLAGLVNADIGLIVPDFRACERTFQLLCQVAGRAGRGFWPGRVIVQTYCPNHYAIQLASKHDYATFYKKELAYRRQFNYPPFSKMIRMVFNHSNANRCRDEAKRMAFLLTSESKRLGMADMTVMGPTPAPVQRLRGRYRWQIVLRGIKPKDLLDMVTVPSGWSVDVDPIGVL